MKKVFIILLVIGILIASVGCSAKDLGCVNTDADKRFSELNIGFDVGSNIQTLVVDNTTGLVYMLDREEETLCPFMKDVNTQYTLGDIQQTYSNTAKVKTSKHDDDK